MPVAPTIAELEGDPHPVLARLRAERAGVLGARSSTAGWSPGATSCWRRCATTRRSPSTTRASRPAASSARACSAATAPSTTATASRSPRRSAVRPSWSGSPSRVADEVDDAHRRLRGRRPGRAAQRLRGAARRGDRGARASGSTRCRTDAVLGWYAAIVGAVTDVTAGRELPESGRRGLRGARATRSSPSSTATPGPRSSPRRPPGPAGSSATRSCRTRRSSCSAGSRRPRG